MPVVELLVEHEEEAEKSAEYDDEKCDNIKDLLVAKEDINDVTLHHFP